MTNDKPSPVEVRVTEKGPWWLHVLDKHGITTLFSLALLWGAYELSQRHFEFLDGQTNQMLMQTKSLETIARSNIRQEQVLDKVSESLENGTSHMKAEHQKILERLK